ncbi:MAG: hypothetical protein V7L20_31520 [Nostoc sp.]|uniref:hypothetical protein n=1 Tax=Nostoc sp. TaxID=1180 RepID=UPI002FFBCE2D
MTKRLLLPALYDLARSNLLPQEFAIVGVAHTQISQNDFRSQLNRDIHEFATVSVDDRLWQQLEQRSYYLCGEFQDAKMFQQLQNLFVNSSRSRMRHSTKLPILLGKRL